MTYMEETHVERQAVPAQRIRMQKPKYPIIHWNRYQAALRGEAKTNNVSER